jgi:hypothetical protein
MAGNGTIASVCALALWIGGCPKRQGPASVVVYVPAKAGAPNALASSPDVWVIEEPAPPPPAPEATPPPVTPQPTTLRRPTRPARSATPTEPDETSTPETPETPPAEVPLLEPQESSAQENVLRDEVLSLQQNVRQRMSRLNPARLSANERKTLDDASTFLAQSTRAFESGDFQRALNLARKASLLVAALE